MSPLEIALLGPPRVSQDGTPLTAPFWNKTLALLSYLALEADRPHRREALAGLLWAEEPEEAARHSLRQALNQLRQGLGEDTLLDVTARTVQFRRDANVTVDAVEFSALLAACRGHTHRRVETCPACAARLERAVALYRGELLAGFLPKDSPVFEEWVIVQRERLAREMLWALYAQAQGAARRGDCEGMEQAARRQIELDPFREKAHRQLLRALAWSDQTNAALAHYARLKQLLRQELEARPEDETLTLVERIRAGELHRPPLPSLRNWPAALPPLLGREAELTALSEFLQSPSARLVTVLGTGGVGKTSLALEAAARNAPSFADGACFVPLAAVPGPEFVVSAIATALGQPPGSGDPQVQLRAFLERQDLLLILDSLEHLLPAAPRVAELLAACPRLTVLATSREPLHLRAEQQFQLAPLAVPDPTRLPAVPARLVAALAQIPSVALFVQRARAVEASFALDESNAATVGAICTRLEGLPLAIELAAAQVHTLALPELLARLERRLAFLVNGFHDLPPRQRTLRATLDWSYDRLAPEEKALLARIAVFAGGCTPEAAGEVCLAPGEEPPAVDTVLRALVSKSLLLRQEVAQVGSWLTMLDMVHEYAGSRLAERAEEEAVRDRHARYYMVLAETLRPSIGAPGSASPLARLEQERNNLRAALQWAVQLGRREVAVRLGAALWMFWELRGDYAEGRNWLAAVLRSCSPSMDSAALAPGPTLIMPWIRLLLGAGVLAGDMGHYTEAVTRLGEALALARQVDDRNLQAVILAWRGWAAGIQGDYEQSIASYEASMVLNRMRGKPAGQVTNAFCLNGLGRLALDRKDYGAARNYLEQSLALRRELDDANGMLCSQYNLGQVALYTDDPVQAHNLYRESLRLAWTTHDDVYIAMSLFGLAQVYLAQGQPAPAVRLLGQIEQHYHVPHALFDAATGQQYEQILATARAELGEQAFQEARDKDAALPLAQIIAEISREDA